ncbi:MAG: hypothetical protein JWL82_74 [Parcubacteria group bacterium]|nr:hypothetical protein [Parcubacteria group bacterium]
MSTEYTVILPMRTFLGYERIGSRYLAGESLPSHCTVMRWFRLAPNCKERMLRSEMEAWAESVEGPYIELMSERREFFGPEEDRPVHVVAENQLLRQLHATIFAWLTNHAAIFNDPAYVDNGYRPHVSDYGSWSFGVGMRHRFERLDLVKRDRHGYKTVVMGEGLGEIPF